MHQQGIQANVLVFNSKVRWKIAYIKHSLPSPTGPPEDVETMVAWTARLPCRVKNLDTPQLVLWYRRRENHPFYRYRLIL